MPKLRLYLFTSIIAIFLNIFFSIYLMILNNTFGLLSLLTGFGTSFIPFFSTISLVFTFGSIPVEVIALWGIITTIISIIQAYLIATIILNYLPLVDV